MWKKWTYILSRHPGRDPWSAGNNKECGRNGLTHCQGTQAEIHGQLGTTKNVKEMHLHSVKAPRHRSMISWEQQRMEEMDLLAVKAPRQRSMVSWEQQGMWKKGTYILSRHPGKGIVRICLVDDQKEWTLPNSVHIQLSTAWPIFETAKYHH